MVACGIDGSRQDVCENLRNSYDGNNILKATAANLKCVGQVSIFAPIVLRDFGEHFLEIGVVFVAYYSWFMDGFAFSADSTARPIWINPIAHLLTAIHAGLNARTILVRYFPIQPHDAIVGVSCLTASGTVFHVWSLLAAIQTACSSPLKRGGLRLASAVFGLLVMQDCRYDKCFHVRFVFSECWLARLVVSLAATIYCDPPKLNQCNLLAFSTGCASPAQPALSVVLDCTETVTASARLTALAVEYQICEPAFKELRDTKSNPVQSRRSARDQLERD